MRTKVLSGAAEQQFVLVCEKGDDPIEQLEAFARRHSISSARLTGIGAFREVTLGYFDPAVMDYRRNRVDE
jgi:predicted DNA-binding protein with PD1-like motif